MIVFDRISRHARTASWRRLRHTVIAFVQTAGTACLLFAYADAAVADGLGQLFFSAEERRTLDELRDADAEPESEIKTGSNQLVPIAPVVDVISFDGKVERSGGGSTIWVNGRPVYTGDTTPEGIRIKASPGTSGETQFVLPPSDAGTTKFSLKVGQKIAVQNGRKFDVYETRPGEDAETVFAKELPADAGSPPEGVNSPQDAGSPATPAPSEGS